MAPVRFRPLATAQALLIKVAKKMAPKFNSPNKASRALGFGAFYIVAPWYLMNGDWSKSPKKL